MTGPAPADPPEGARRSPPDATRETANRLLRALRWPLVAVTIGAIGTVTAFVLDQTPAYEYALTIGAPSLWLLVAGTLWLGVAAVLYLIRSRRTDVAP